MTTPIIRSMIVAELDELEVPDCDVRRIALALLDTMETPDRDGHTPMAHDALAVLMRGIRDLYEPRSPLRVQLDAERTQRSASERGFSATILPG